MTQACPFPLVIGVVRETLEVEGLGVEICKDGTTALKKIESSKHYELLILDQDLLAAK